MSSGPTVPPIAVLAVEPPTPDGPVVAGQLADDDSLSVRTVPDAPAAQQALAEDHVDCVVCHHDPPTVDGVKVLSGLRAAYPELPILLATETDYADDAIEVGATDIVPLSEGRFDRGLIRHRLTSLGAAARERGKYEQLFDRANDGIVIHDPETGEVLEANDRLYRLLGYDPDALEELTLEHMVAEEGPYTEAMARDLVRRAATDGPQTFEWLDETAAGEPRWVEVSLEATTLGGSRCVLAIVRDITDRKENERLLRDREQQLAAVFDHPSSFAVVLDDAGRVVRANRPALSLLDGGAETVEGVELPATPWLADTSDARDRVRAAFERALDGETPQLTVGVDAADGTRYVDLRFDAVGEEGSVENVVVAGYDITERRERGRAADLLAALSEASPDYAFVHNAEGRYLDALVGGLNDDDALDADDLLGETVDEMLPEPAARTIREGIRETLATGEETAVEYALEDGRWFEARVVALDEPYDGEEAALLVARDVTERRARERELDETRERLERTLERVDDAFFAVDDDWRVTYVNETGAEVLRRAMGADYDDEALVGRHLWAEIPDAVETRFYDAYTRAMETQEPVSFEAEYAPLDTWFEVSAYPDEDGLSVYFSDITDRKRREQVRTDLLETTREFIRVDDPDTVADRVVAAFSEVFGYEHCVVRLHDAEAGTLPPTRVSPAMAERAGSLPTYGDDEALVGQVFESGESVVVDDIGTTSEYDYGPFDAALLVSLGDHGTLAVTELERRAFDDEDAALVELLALAATTALDRLARERETRQLQRILDVVDARVFLLGRDGRFTYATESLASYLGRDREALVGSRLTDVVTPGDADACDRALAAVFDPTRGDTTAELTVAAADGERPVEVALSVTASGGSAEVAGVVTDISELSETRTDLATERERFQGLFENLPDPVVEVEYADGEPVVRYANPAFSETFGFDATVLRGANLNEHILPARSVGEARTLDDRATAGERLTAEVQRETADGPRDFLLRWTPYPRSREGPGTYGFAVYTDITEQRERERYLKVMQRVLRHNLRNDLNVVTGLAGMLETRVEDPALADHASQLRGAAEELVALSEKARAIEDVVGREGRTENAVEVTALLRRAVADRAPDEGSVDLDTPGELWVVGTEDVQRAFAELVENAVEHTDPGTSVRVEVGTDGTDGQVTIRFHDDGPGIPDGEWAVVSGEADITQLSHATGLGLWLARWLVESCGGELRQERRLDGTTLAVDLRRGSPPAESTATARTD